MPGEIKQEENRFESFTWQRMGSCAINESRHPWRSRLDQCRTKPQRNAKEFQGTSS